MNTSARDPFTTLQSIVEQLEFCNYKTDDDFHDLKMNAAFIKLKEVANKISIPLDALVSQAACGHWQKGKPKKECYFVYRDNKEDNYPSLYEAKLEENILCVFNIQDDEFIYTMEEMADGEFFIIEK